MCHQLGYSGAESYSVNHKYGIQDTMIILKNVLCGGDEANLMDCSFEEYRWPVISDGRVAGVSCFGEPASTITWTPEPTSTTSPSPSTCPHGWLDAGHLGCFLLQENITVDSWWAWFKPWCILLVFRYEANIVCEDLGGFLMEPKSAETQVPQFFWTTYSLELSLWTFAEPGLLLVDNANWWAISWARLVDRTNWHQPRGGLGLGECVCNCCWFVFVCWLERNTGQVHEAEFAEEQFWATPPDTSEGNHADCALLSRQASETASEWLKLRYISLHRNHDYMWRDQECWGSNDQQPRGILCQQ